MAIEWLTIEVPEADRDRFMVTDREIWTTFLANCPGFIRKQVWVNPEQTRAGLSGGGVGESGFVEGDRSRGLGGGGSIVCGGHGAGVSDRLCGGIYGGGLMIWRM
jgi:hypothetical protein